MTPANNVRPSASIVRAFRRWVRPAILALLRSLPSPEKCGCAARKDWMIKQIEVI
jgi:hypothetical protein